MVRLINNVQRKKLDEIDFIGLSFLQDDAPPHFANATTKLLGEMFGESVISINEAVIWRPRSCDLKPSKLLVYNYRSRTKTL